MAGHTIRLRFYFCDAVIYAVTSNGDPADRSRVVRHGRDGMYNVAKAALQEAGK